MYTSNVGGYAIYMYGYLWIYIWICMDIYMYGRIWMCTDIYGCMKMHGFPIPKTKPYQTKPHKTIPN
jgi:hypothetical protein